MQFVKCMPSCAMRSMFGVRIHGLTTPSESHRCWSVMIKRMFGLLNGPPVAENVR